MPNQAQRSWTHSGPHSPSCWPGRAWNHALPPSPALCPQGPIPCCVLLASLSCGALDLLSRLPSGPGHFCFPEHSSALSCHKPSPAGAFKETGNRFPVEHAFSSPHTRSSQAHVRAAVTCHTQSLKASRLGAQGHGPEQAPVTQTWVGAAPWPCSTTVPLLKFMRGLIRRVSKSPQECLVLGI